jgi:hypothetical protein
MWAQGPARPDCWWQSSPLPGGTAGLNRLGALATPHTGGHSKLRPDLMLKLGFWTPGPNSWDSTWQVWPLAPKRQIKRHGDRQRKEVYYTVQDTLWEEAEQALPIFSHLRGTDMSVSFK